MANTCSNVITVIGLTKSAEDFIKELSISMFNIDLDAMEPFKWSEDASVDGKTYYQTLVEERRVERATHYCVLFPNEPYNRGGVTASRFCVDTKWIPVVPEIVKASESHPDLAFHVHSWLMSDGQVSEYVVRNGNVIEAIKRQVSWCALDWLVFSPSATLLAAHLPLTFPQRAASRVQDATDIFKDLRSVLEERWLVASPSDAKVQLTKKTVDETLEYLSEVAKVLTFEGVFIDDLKP